MAKGKKRNKPVPKQNTESSTSKHAVKTVEETKAVSTSVADNTELKQDIKPEQELSFGEKKLLRQQEKAKKDAERIQFKDSNNSAADNRQQKSEKQKAPSGPERDVKIENRKLQQHMDKDREDSIKKPPKPMDYSEPKPKSKKFNRTGNKPDQESEHKKYSEESVSAAENPVVNLKPEEVSSAQMEVSYVPHQEFKKSSEPWDTPEETQESQNIDWASCDDTPNQPIVENFQSNQAFAKPEMSVNTNTSYQESSFRYEYQEEDRQQPYRSDDTGFDRGSSGYYKRGQGFRNDRSSTDNRQNRSRSGNVYQKDNRFPSDDSQRQRYGDSGNRQSWNISGEQNRSDFSRDNRSRPNSERKYDNRRDWNRPGEQSRSDSSWDNSNRPDGNRRGDAFSDHRQDRNRSGDQNRSSSSDQNRSGPRNYGRDRGGNKYSERRDDNGRNWNRSTGQDKSDLFWDNNSKSDDSKRDDSFPDDRQDRNMSRDRYKSGSARKNNWAEGGGNWNGGRGHSTQFDDNDRSRKSGFRFSYEGRKDEGFEEFLCRFKQREPVNYGRVKEEIGDLFNAPAEFALAHCVAADMSMGAGIAKMFRSQFGKVAFLLNQRQETGGLAVLEQNERFIYYLVTKEQSRGKPTYHTLWMSLQKLKDHMKEKNVTKLAIPQIGCGLDRLEWSTVKQMLEFVFQDDEVEIVVYILEENPDESTRKQQRKCFVVQKVLPLIDIESGTGLLYFGTEDESVSEEMTHLSTKFNILPRYKAGKRSLCDVLKVEDRGEYIYGLIIRKTENDNVDFVCVERTLRTLRNMIKQDGYNYVGFQGFIDKKDKILVDKILTLMQYILVDVEIWICWPKHLESYCPQQKTN